MGAELPRPLGGESMRAAYGVGLDSTLLARRLAPESQDLGPPAQLRSFALADGPNEECTKERTHKQSMSENHASPTATRF